MISRANALRVCREETVTHPSGRGPRAAFFPNHASTARDAAPLPEFRFKLAKRLCTLNNTPPGPDFRSYQLTVIFSSATRHLSWSLSRRAFARPSRSPLRSRARSARPWRKVRRRPPLWPKPVSPARTMALRGHAAKAPVTITDTAAMTCPTLRGVRGKLSFRC